MVLGASDRSDGKKAPSLAPLRGASPEDSQRPGGGRMQATTEAREPTRGSKVDIGKITECSQLKVEQTREDAFHQINEEGNIACSNDKVLYPDLA